MNEYPTAQGVAAARQTLATLNQQADGVRAELRRLHEDLAQVQRDFSSARAAQLLEANEQLLLAAVRAETIAETAVSNLGELARSSQRDALTDTPNRALMLDRLTYAMAMARRHATRVAVLFLDLDDFKPINDVLGHAVGDAVLQHAARRLESVVRDSDTVSRHGGDEFLVLLTDVAQAGDAGLIAAKMLQALAAPALVGGHTLCLSASVGIAIYPEDGEDAATLISRADAAMYRAKYREPGGFAFHRAQLPEAKPETRPRPSGREPVLRNLREANEQLVIAAMDAQKVGDNTAAAHRRQIAFLAMVAHELRNPLAPIRTAAELLGRAPDAAMLVRLQVILKRQVAQMTRLVEDLLDGARFATGKFKLERSPIGMAGVLVQAADVCRPAMDARHQNFTLHLPSEPMAVRGDPVRLVQIFTNLLDNACKYTPDGGAISLAATLSGRALEVRVSDNGIGVSAEALPRIFDLFVQDPSAVSSYNGGLGIGLAIVRELVEAHGGTVVGRSGGETGGSSFVVTLPLTDEVAPTA